MVDYINAITLVLSMGSSVRMESLYLGIALCGTRVGFPDITSLLVLNRCPTKDRILGWGLQADPSCVLCNSATESRNHLFFDCSFAWHLWESCSVRCGIIPERRWERVMDQLQLLSLNSTKSTLLRICWQGCMYWTWTERNARIHRQIFRSPDSIFRLLGRQIRNRILSLHDSSPTLSPSLMQTWLV